MNLYPVQRKIKKNFLLQLEIWMIDEDLKCIESFLRLVKMKKGNIDRLLLK